ncbi:TPA: hypothetical protein L4E43_003541 [Pseudomonas aeruginosa]|nr:hypothetical protein [Pseudomonas aeruginosa]
MSIDWNTAPEGATHWEPRGIVFGEGWMKKVGNEWSYLLEGSEVWADCFVSAEREATFEARPQEAWDGQGLPPTGLLVEWKSGLDHEWRRVTVLAYANGDAWLQPEDGDSFIVGNPENFRRIRTPEQIAAEEREKAVQEMLALDEYPHGQDRGGMMSRADFCRVLYDAGYRRQESST